MRFDKKKVVVLFTNSTFNYALFILGKREKTRSCLKLKNSNIFLITFDANSHIGPRNPLPYSLSSVVKCIKLLPNSLIGPCNPLPCSISVKYK